MGIDCHSCTGLDWSGWSRRINWICRIGLISSFLGERTGRQHFGWVGWSHWINWIESLVRPNQAPDAERSCSGNCRSQVLSGFTLGNWPAWGRFAVPARLPGGKAWDQKLAPGQSSGTCQRLIRSPRKLGLVSAFVLRASPARRRFIGGKPGRNRSLALVCFPRVTRSFSDFDECAGDDGEFDVEPHALSCTACCVIRYHCCVMLYRWLRYAVPLVPLMLVAVHRSSTQRSATTTPMLLKRDGSTVTVSPERLESPTTRVSFRPWSSHGETREHAAAV